MKLPDIFLVSICGDNCAKWLLKIGEMKDVTINLRHMMKFGKRKFTIRILNNCVIAHNMDYAGKYCLETFSMKGRHEIEIRNNRCV